MMPNEMQEQAEPVPATAPAAQPGAKPAQDPKAMDTVRRLGLAAAKIVFDPNTSKQLVEMMRAGADDPAQAVAQAASTVIGQISERVTGIEPKLAFTVAPAVVVFLMELAGAAKLFPPSKDIMQAALQGIGQQAGGGPQAPQQQPAPAPQGPPQGMVASAMQPQPMGG